MSDKDDRAEVTRIHYNKLDDLVTSETSQSFDTCTTIKLMSEYLPMKITLMLEITKARKSRRQSK